MVLGRLRLYAERVQHFPWRIYGSSLLIIYESDADALRQTLPHATASLECEAEEELDDDDDNSQEDDDEEEKKWAFTLKAIDFAHAWQADEGSGADEGYNAGLETLIKLIEGRIRELEV